MVGCFPVTIHRQASCFIGKEVVLSNMHETADHTNILTVFNSEIFKYQDGLSKIKVHITTFKEALKDPFNRAILLHGKSEEEIQEVEG